MGNEDGDNGPYHVVLNREHVFQLAIIPFRPMMGASGSIDELCRDPHPVAVAANAAFEHIVHTEAPVFEKFADYVPRQEPASWLAGGKRIASDRLEWIIIAEHATAGAALQSDVVY